jgi:hypothetical protein
MHMLVVAFLKWWYGTGWLLMVRKTGARLQRILSFFSVFQLAGSLFAPYRQVSAGEVSGPIGQRLQAFGDQLLSRVIGAIIRTGLIIGGVVVAIAFALVGLAMMLTWPFVPILPILGIILATGKAA